MYFVCLATATRLRPCHVLPDHITGLRCGGDEKLGSQCCVLETSALRSLPTLKTLDPLSSAARDDLHLVGKLDLQRRYADVRAAASKLHRE